MSLFDATGCSRLLYTEERSQKAVELQALRPSLDEKELPTLAEMMAAQTTLYPFPETFERLKNETAFIIHSSGTTGMFVFILTDKIPKHADRLGLPKPLNLTFGYLGAIENIPSLPVPPGRTWGMPHIFGPEDPVFSTTPFFHLMGIGVFILSVLHDVPFILAPEKPMSAELATEVLNMTKPTAASFPPSLLEDMTRSPASMEALSNLQYVFFGSAPLSPEVGDKIKEHTRLVNWIGSSEAGFLPSLLPEDKNDWNYFEWNPSYGLEMQPVGEGYHELVIPRPANIDYHAIFHVYPDSPGYRTKDLFVPHPTRPNLWTYVGRHDDVIVLSNGEKLNPITMEKIIEGHPLVSRALVIGQSRFQTALLVEPSWHLWSEGTPAGELVEEIWPTVQKANQVGPAHGRILKNKIGVASQSKPFKNTPKGSTKRRQTIEDYAEEVEKVYNNMGNEGVEFELPKDADLSTVTTYLRNIISNVLDSSALTDQTDFYAIGVDSLQTMHLSNVLRSALQSHTPTDSSRSISPQDIYANPTLELLARLVYSIMRGSIENGVPREEKISALLDKYTSDLPEQKLDVSNTSGQHTVILTGSTGSLGNYILHALLHDSTVAKVYCLNRSEAQERQTKSFEEKGLSFGANAENKVEFLQASFGAEYFGLPLAKYTEMLDTVDTIIHNAWRVDFNITVDSFGDVHIRSVRRFVDFSLHSQQHAHIHFVSSVATIGAWKAIHGPAVASEPIETTDVVLPQGYGESKHIGERICLAASRRTGVPTTVHRIGQIAGPTTAKGLWSRQEWFPTIITTSKALGKVPDTLGSMPVDWIPVDSLASIMLDLIATRRDTAPDTRCAVFNLVNPSVTSWDTLLPAIEATYSIQPIPLSEWISELEKIESPTAEDIIVMPALKLLDFYRGLAEGGALSVPIDVGKTKEASQTMKELKAVSGGLMANWMRQWDF